MLATLFRAWPLPLALMLSACGGGGGGGESAQAPTGFIVSGTVSGLAGKSITLLNRDDSLTIAIDGPFAFPSKWVKNDFFGVEIKSSPEGKFCAVANGKGLIVDKNVTDVKVSCGEMAFSHRLQFGGSAGDGTAPEGLGLSWDGSLFGTTASGGSADRGAVYQWKPSGEYKLLHSFAADGTADSPTGALIQGQDGKLYGVTNSGGVNGAGVLFQLSEAGEVKTLLSFESQSMSRLRVSSGLILGWDGSLYGTAPHGGPSGAGIVYKVSTRGEASVLHAFASTQQTLGRYPLAGITQSWDGLYGTTAYGGVNDQGTVFRLGNDGSLKSIYSFTNGPDGRSPSSLTQGADGNFYGVTSPNEARPAGGIFRITPTGTFTLLHAFDQAVDGYPLRAYSNEHPRQRLLLASNRHFYGTNPLGGAHGFGTLYQITPEGKVSVIHAFAGGADGAHPAAELIQVQDGTIYGVTRGDGVQSKGTLFQLAVKAP